MARVKSPTSQMTVTKIPYSTRVTLVPGPVKVPTPTPNPGGDIQI